MDKALTEAPAAVAGWCVLGAEINWKDGKPVVVRPRIKWSALRATGRSIGVAVRIAAWSGPFLADDAGANCFRVELIRLLEEMETAGVECAEVQIDFDCADSKLPGYAVWLREAARVCGRERLGFTALPSWLEQPAFPILAAEAASFVLQVHLLNAPSRDGATTLCDPASVRRWAEQASAFGRPFFVALPTYTSFVGRDPRGRTLGVISDGPKPAWPPATKISIYAADPVGLAGLVAGWHAHPLAGLRGLVWFRLPVVTDENNWPWCTLEAVMQGSVPEAEWKIEMTRGAVIDVSLRNIGKASGVTPAVEITWDGAVLETADAVAHWHLRAAADSVIFSSSGGSLLRPSGRRPVGWLRFNSITLPHARLLP